MANIIVRDIDEPTHARLKHEAESRGVSVNALMQQFIRSGLRLRDGRAGPYTDLDKLAGSWSARDQKEFNASVAPLSEIDETLWR